MARGLSLRHAAALGLLQGPSELLPISSSAHTALAPRLLGWREVELDVQARNDLEVALHAGTAGALLLLLSAPGARRQAIREARSLDPRRLAALALALAPPAVVGRLLERRLERRPGSAPTIAVGLLAGGAALALADTCPQTRALADAGPGDGLVLGVAQALALLPGVSRNGATLTAARARGFARADAQALSWRVGVPVLLGAVALKLVRLRGRRAAVDGAVAAGAAGAFLSTLISAPLLRPERSARPLLPFALYRCALALAAIRPAAFVAGPRAAGGD
ncbi:MAG TPA: undecaprenyl-diphosphate phosphatase [Solirubrobacteraceae bacterium]|nr:undecaprenyl-diphosphate phosphatase [Solirubrobacteraceae bacterium]